MNASAAATKCYARGAVAMVDALAAAMAAPIVTRGLRAQKDHTSTHGARAVEPGTQ